MCGGASESVSKLTIRSKGPAVAKPGPRAGIKIEEQMSAKGAAPYELGTRIIPIFVPALCRAFGAHSSFILIPGLTAGAIFTGGPSGLKKFSNSGSTSFETALQSRPTCLILNHKTSGASARKPAAIAFPMFIIKSRLPFTR